MNIPQPDRNERQSSLFDALRQEAEEGRDDYKQDPRWEAVFAAVQPLSPETVTMMLLDLDTAITRYRDALTRIKAQQPMTLAKLRKHGVVFDGPLGADPKNFQHVAFSIYTDLCEVDSWARDALETDE